MAKWSVGQRTSGFDDAGMQRAIDEGRILRTHVLRPTWHFVAATDILWIQALTAPRVHAFNASYYRGHGLDDQHAARAAKAFTEVLRGGNHLTRKELSAALAKVGIDATGNRLAYIVMRAELDGLIANGAMRGKQHTYALISERAPDAVTMEPDEALAELTRRYFTSHGPATVKDFSWWSSLTATQIRRGLELVGSALVSEKVDRHTFWYAPSPPPVAGPVAHRACAAGLRRVLRGVHRKPTDGEPGRAPGACPERERARAPHCPGQPIRRLLAPGRQPHRHRRRDGSRDPVDRTRAQGGRRRVRSLREVRRRARHRPVARAKRS